MEIGVVRKKKHKRGYGKKRGEGKWRGGENWQSGEFGKKPKAQNSKKNI